MFSLTVVQLNVAVIITSLVPHTPGIWKITFYISPEVKAASFWTTLWGVGYDSLFDEPITIGSVTADLDQLNEVLTLAELSADDSAFYWDNDNQTLYVTTSDFDPPYSYDVLDIAETLSFISGAQRDDNGMPTDTILNNRYYEPRLLGDVTDQQTIDDLGNNQMTFDSFSFSIDNSDGAFDNIRNQINGQVSKILHKEQESKIIFADLDVIRFGVVNDVSFTDRNAVQVKVSDPRQSWKAKANDEIFDDADWPALPENYNDKRVPLAVGDCYNIPTVQVNTTTFLFSTTTYGAVSADTVYVDGTSTSFVDNGDGTVTIAGYTSGNVTADVTGVDKGNIAEMILWFIEEFAGIPYTASYYNQTEVQDVIDVAFDGGYYCGTSGEKLKDIIDLLSASINTYIFTQGDKFTMRDLTDTTEVTEIYTDQLLVSPAPWSFDSERYASSQQAGYKKDWDADNFLTLFDKTKQTEAFENNNLDVPAEFDTALLTEANAQTILTQRYLLSVLAQRLIEVSLGTAIDFVLLDYVIFTHERPGKGIIVPRSKYRVVSISKIKRTASLLFVEEVGPPLYEVVFDFSRTSGQHLFEFDRSGATQVFDFEPNTPQEATV